jgi:hypothetical protein
MQQQRQWIYEKYSVQISHNSDKYTTFFTNIIAGTVLLAEFLAKCQFCDSVNSCILTSCSSL